MLHAADETVVVALTTAPDAGTATAIADRLLEERLIACANVLPGATSMYRWDGEVRTESEVVVVLKSIAGVRDRLTRRVIELHPYDVPEVLFLDTSGGSEAYLDWVRGEVATP